MRVKAWQIALLLGGLFAASAAGLFVNLRNQGRVRSVVPSVGEVRAVHAAVFVAEREIRGVHRISAGDRIATGPGGRARLRLDDGSLLAVDASTRFSVSGRGVSLEQGRIFLASGQAARTEVSLGGVTASVAASAVAFERKNASSASVYCAEGELVLSAAGKQTRVESGETATVTGDAIEVAPEKAFDDWTHGLAVPWYAESKAVGVIPEARAQNDDSEPGTPLVVRAQRADVRIDGELAITRSRTTLFNGAASAAHANVRLALPRGAILRRVARRVGSARAESEATLAIATGASGPAARVTNGLEWAGGGVVRGDLGPIAAGETIDLTLEYSEWLGTQSGRAAYRYPLAAAPAPLVGELAVEVDASQSQTPTLGMSSGARANQRTITLRQTDTRPSSDLVLELAPKVVRPNAARAYVVPGGKGEDPYVLVRTELPEHSSAGVTLVLVLDTSMSVGAQALETERSILDAVLDGLGAEDSLVVLAADQSVRALGSEAPAPVDAALRSAIKSAALSLRPGGASNLALALTRAADVLDAPSRGERAGAGMIVYVGDGRPSVGDDTPENIRRAIGRRSGGVPRLSAIAVGPNADPWSLAKLVEGTGALYEVLDPSDAARASAALLEDALLPTLRDVGLDLGPNVDRVYPRTARALLSGSTVSLVGRLRGKLPTRVSLRYRDGARVVQESRLLYRTQVPQAADIVQRWAEARMQDMAARDEGIEAALALARAANLFSPWTSFFFSPGDPKPQALSFVDRELSPAYDSGFAARLGTVSVTGSSLLEPSHQSVRSVSLREAAAAAIRRVLERAANAVRACRDARAGVRPDLGRRFSIELSVDAGGRATRIRVVAIDVKGGDPVLERCIRGVVESLPYFAAGLPIDLSHTLLVPEARPPRKTRCSGASQVALPVRKELWRARETLGVDQYLEAAQACELPRWADRRAYLLVLLDRISVGSDRLTLAREFEAAGETDAANFVRRETLRRVTDFGELANLSRQLRQDEPAADDDFDRAYAAAGSDPARLAVVRRFLELSPHSTRVRLRLLAVLEALGRKELLVNEIAKFRGEPLADAGLLAAAGSSLRRMGFDEEGRKVFGELVERAPRDPWTLAYVGDRLRAEGMFDEALTAYESLTRALPNDAGATLRLALAHAGAGRLDVATRLLDRVSQTGGRNDDGRLAELSSVIRAVSLSRARASGHGAEVDAELERRLLQTPLPDVAGLILVESPPSDDPVAVRVRRERGESGEQTPDLDASELGLAALRIERGASATKILLSRAPEPGPSRAARAIVSALVLAPEQGLPTLIVREVDVSRDGKPVELRFDGQRLL